MRYYCYFGDGGGERYFSRTDINELTNDLICLAPLSVILMGCNSGMLMSPNCPNGRLGDKIHLSLYLPFIPLRRPFLCSWQPCGRHRPRH